MSGTSLVPSANHEQLNECGLDIKLRAANGGCNENTPC